MVLGSVPSTDSRRLAFRGEILYSREDFAKDLNMRAICNKTARFLGHLCIG